MRVYEPRQAAQPLQVRQALLGGQCPYLSHVASSHRPRIPVLAAGQEGSCACSPSEASPRLPPNRMALGPREAEVPASPGSVEANTCWCPASTGKASRLSHLLICLPEEAGFISFTPFLSAAVSASSPCTWWRPWQLGRWPLSAWTSLPPPSSPSTTWTPVWPSSRAR